VTKLRNNIAINIGSQIWVAVVSIAFIPYYIKILGIEAFGLIGFFISLQVLLTLFDAGISSALTRELAISADADRSRTLVRFMELAYWPIGIVLSLILFFSRELISETWLNAATLDSEQLRSALGYMALAIVFQWPCTLYSSGLKGLERQIELGVLNALFATLRGACIVPILIYYSDTITVFFAWQATIWFIQSMTMALLLWIRLPEGNIRNFSFLGSLTSIKKYAIGVSGITVTAVLLTQMDKIILSRIIQLDEFGYYALASTVIGAFSIIVQPFFSVFFSRYTILSTGNDLVALSSMYHKSNQYLAVLVASAGAILVFYSYDIILIWTGSPAIANGSGFLLSLLAFGAMINGFITLPYAVQLASGITSITLKQNMVSLAISTPLIIYLATHYGAAGAAFVAILLNIGFFFISIPVMHRHILHDELSAWYKMDIFPALVASLATTGTLKILIGEFNLDTVGFFGLTVISLLTLAAAALATGQVREGLVRTIKEHQK
jgi:O-antigen/teichoic acid export membrane protein